MIGILATGAQANSPPSMHPSGEQWQWEGGVRGEPGEATYAEIMDGARRVWEACGGEVKPPREPKPKKATTAGGPTGHLARGTVGTVSTGQRGEVEEQTPDDQKVIDNFLTSADSEKFGRIIAGDFGDYADDHSAAHQAVCNWLVWNGVTQLSRARRNLSRFGVFTSHEKWHREDYWQRTFNEAVDGVERLRNNKKGVVPSELTDIANAKRFVRENRDRVKYIGPEHTYRVYNPNGGVWARDDGRRVEYLAQRTIEAMRADASKELHLARAAGGGDDDPAVKAAEARLAHAVRSMNVNRVLAVTRLASSNPDGVLGRDADGGVTGLPQVGSG